jgi:hypothetical protein
MRLDEPSDNLLEGERIHPFDGHEESTSSLTDEEIDERYVNAEVRIVVEQARYPLKQIPDIVGSADYNLQPSFQRRPRWDRDRQSRLIESLIMNVPIPPIFLYESEYGKYEVMDGRQRLTAIRDFYTEDYELTGLTEWPELNGRRYSKLPEQVRRGIDRRFLSAILLLHETAKSPEQANILKQLVFERINNGGEDLSRQETRNALYPGPMNTLCLRLARTPSLCKMWEIPEPDSGEDQNNPDWSPPIELAQNETYRKMEDAELVLRFFSHRQRLDLWKSNTRLDDFLTYYLREANQFKEEVLIELDRLFVSTVDLAFDLLGVTAFHLFRPRGEGFAWVRRPAFIAYDPILSSLARLQNSAEDLRKSSADIRQGLETFYQEKVEIFDGRKTNPSDIRARDLSFLEYFSRYC